MKPEEITKVAVIGAGLMGHGIAQMLASQGCAVSLLDLSQSFLEKALENIGFNLRLMAEHGLFPSGKIPSIVEKIKTTTDLEFAVRDSQIVIEAVSENVNLKQKIFQKMDALCPRGVILATNTSVISITEIANKTLNAERVVGTHFWNPPYLIPLVEVIRGEKTSIETMNTTFDFLKRMGKHPVWVNKDVPGFVGNRLQHALWREALSIVENGIADPKTVDEVIKNGFGIRLSVLGPFENMDMVGLDITYAIHDYLLKHLETSPRPAAILGKKLEQKELGFKTGQGFQKWSPAEIQQSRERLLNYLLKWQKEKR
jgi:3-hydroxybutyryl-CoA dehydrogenase